MSSTNSLAQAALALLAFVISGCRVAEADPRVKICLAQDYDGPEVYLPAGTVFEYGGHLLGDNLRDIVDNAHNSDTLGANGTSMWKGLTPDEVKRREDLIDADAHRDLKHTSAIVLMTAAKVSVSSPCEFAEAGVALSSEWGWTATSVFPDATEIYQAHGVFSQGSYQTTYLNEDSPLSDAIVKGALNAQAQGAITRQFTIPSRPD